MPREMLMSGSDRSWLFCFDLAIARFLATAIFLISNTSHSSFGLLADSVLSGEPASREAEAAF